MVTLSALQGEKRAAIMQLAARHGARNVRSVARGENRETSDLDLLAEFDEGRTLFDLIAFWLDLGDLLGTNVDVVTPAGLRYIRESVLADARSI